MAANTKARLLNQRRVFTNYALVVGSILQKGQDEKPIDETVLLIPCSAACASPRDNELSSSLIIIA